MYTIHEGEIVIKEMYDSSSKSRLYVKPHEQDNIVTLDESKSSNFSGYFTRIFLPQGYPDSVSKDYLGYQIWDTAQAFCSTITGTLATQEVLRGVGVGDTAVTPLAATVTWVMKDGCGHLGRIIFAYTHGCYLDAYSKKWRLYADTLNDAAMCMELALPMFKHYTTLVLCVSTVMKSIVGVAGGATRAAMTQHHAIRGNLADVSAKDAAQETAVNLIASLAALLIISIAGTSITIFLIMILLHIIFNYFAVRAVCLRTLNEPRFLQVIDAYLKQEIISAPCEINLNEPIVFYQMGSSLLDLKLCGFHIKMGSSIRNVIIQNRKASYVQGVRRVYKQRNYILFPDLCSRTIYVALTARANVSETCCAYFHAVLLAIVICALNDYPLAIYKHPKNITRPFAQICLTLQQAEWSHEESEDPDAYFKQNASLELMTYLEKIVQKEWYRIKTGLTRTGWDLTKHLLITDEWRISSEKIVTDSLSMQNFNDRVSLSAATTQVSSFGGLEPPDKYEEEETYTIEPEPVHQIKPDNPDQLQTNQSTK